MSLPLDELREAMRAVGFNPTWITPSRGPGGQVKVTISARYEGPPEPERMIVQPATGLAAFTEFEKIPGVGVKSAEKLREAGIMNLAQFGKTDLTALREIVAPRAMACIDEYIAVLIQQGRPSGDEKR